MTRAALLTALVLAAALAGCGKPKESVTVQTPDGSVTTTEDGGKVEVKSGDGQVATTTTKDGTTTFEGRDAEGNLVKAQGGKDVDMSGLGVPQYPGATLKDEGSQAKVQTGAGTAHSVALTTTDPPQKVIDWYKGQVTVDTSMTTPDGAMLMGKCKDGQQVTVTASLDNGKTTIGIVTQKAP